MKKLLLSSIASLFLATGTAHANSLPSKMLGRWCKMGESEGREVYERGSCSFSSAIDLKQNSYDVQSNEDGEGYGCDFKKIKRLPNGSYFIRAKCYVEGTFGTEDMIFQLVEKQLEIITTTIRFCVAPIEPPLEVAQDPEYNRDAWLALREGPGIRFKIIAKLGWDHLEADIVKGGWMHISNATNKTSTAGKIVQGWVHSKYVKKVPCEWPDEPEYDACHGGDLAACKRWRVRECRKGNPAACDYDEAQKQSNPMDWCGQRYGNIPSQYRFCLNGSPDR